VGEHWKRGLRELGAEAVRAYQIVEASLQLRGEGGENQVKGARRALAQSVGGHGSVAVTHILEA
jgi:acetyl-CoA C-acetyltransferase